MEVRVTFMGPLGEYVGEGTVTFRLPDGACYEDLLKEIGGRFASRFPKGIWDEQKGEFAPGVLAIGEGRDLSRRDAPLREGEEIRVVPLAAGG